MKRILVPCDFSQPAIEALKFAIDLATRSKGRVFVLKAIETPVSYESAFGIQPYTFNPELLKEFADLARKKFSKLQGRLVKVRVPLSFHTEYGGPAPVIRQFIRKRNIDLVVMGTHGSRGMRELLVGSNTEKVVRLSPVPVLAVNKAPRLAAIKHIVFPSTLELKQGRLVGLVKRFQAMLKATVHLVFVNTPGVFMVSDETNAALTSFVRRYGLKNCTTGVWNDVSVQQGILNFTAKKRADLIVMATRGHRGLAHLISGSIAEDTVNHMTCPVLTFTQKG